MPLLKERGHPWYWNEAFLVEIFCWIKPKSKPDIWAHSNKKATLDARLMTDQNFCPVSDTGQFLWVNQKEWEIDQETDQKYMDAANTLQEQLSYNNRNPKYLTANITCQFWMCIVGNLHWVDHVDWNSFNTQKFE